jgi:hypothetical protein
MNSKGLGKKWSQHNLECCPSICLRRIMETTKHLNHNSQSPSQNLIVGPPDMKKFYPFN